MNLRHELQRAHICGVGGIGTSGPAVLLHTLGATLTGSDLRASELTRALSNLGVDIRFKPSPECAARASCLIVPSFFPSDHPELCEAKRLHRPIFNRTEALAAIADDMHAESTLCMGTLSRAKCARWIAIAQHAAFCCGAALNDGSLHAQLSPNPLCRDLVLDLDERDFVQNPSLFSEFHPKCIIFTDYYADNLNYYESDDLPKRFIESASECLKTGTQALIYPAHPLDKVWTASDTDIELTFLCRRFIRGRFADVAHHFTISMDKGAIYLSYPAQNGECHRQILSGTRSDAAAYAASIVWRRIFSPSIADARDIACVGWLERLASHSCGSRLYYDIRMHPVSLRESLETVRALHMGQRVGVAIKPFISTLKSYSPQTWAKALKNADEVFVVSPPYEGCSTDDAETFGRALCANGILARILNLQSDDPVVETRDLPVLLAIGAPDLKERFQEAYASFYKNPTL